MHKSGRAQAHHHHGLLRSHLSGRLFSHGAESHNAQRPSASIVILKVAVDTLFSEFHKFNKVAVRILEPGTL